jgi:hypothetical protein
MLCHKCTGIHLRFYKECSTQLQEALGDRCLKGFLCYLHSLDTACLERTARSGCQFCITIQYRLATECTGIREDTVSFYPIVLHVHSLSVRRDFRELGLLDIESMILVGVKDWGFTNQLRGKSGHLCSL